MTGFLSVTGSWGVTAFYTEKLQTVPTGPKYSTHAVGMYWTVQYYSLGL